MDQPGIESSDEDQVRAEIESAILADGSALGDVWRRLRDGETPEQIGAARGTATHGFVYVYRHFVEAVLGEAPPPTKPTMAQGCARVVRRLLKHNTFSDAATARLAGLLADLEGRASDLDAIEEEDRGARSSTLKAEASATSGIYVYALPHYLRYPFDPASGHTLLKVGHSSRDVIRRFSGQVRTTALPEDPVLLRIYPVPDDESIAVERRFHMMLESADHDRSRARMGGTEWFCTTVRFLDAIAGLMKLEVRVISDLADIE